MKKEIIIKDKDYVNTDEWYGDIYKCPKCKSEQLWYEFNYCPDCGVKIKFDIDNKLNNNLS